MTDGSGEYLQRAIQKPTIKHVTCADGQTSDLKLNTHIQKPKTTHVSPSTAGRAIRATLDSDEQRLAALLLKGYKRGWLTFNPPKG